MPSGPAQELPALRIALPMSSAEGSAGRGASGKATRSIGAQYCSSSVLRRRAAASVRLVGASAVGACELDQIPEVLN